MVNEIPHIKTSLTHEYKKKILFKGSLLAAAGGCLLLTAGIWLPPSSLSNWGIILFLVGFTLITKGLLPYRRLTRLEQMPDQLVVSPSGSLHYFQRGKEVFKLPKQNIESIDYQEETACLPYGLKVELKWPLPIQLSSPQDQAYLQKRRRHSLKYYGCDLFFPFFACRSIEQLRQEL